MSSTTSIVTDGIEPTVSQRGWRVTHRLVLSAMTRPPTPPPTSAVELQDQARSIARERSTTAQLPSSETGTRPEIYQSALSAIIETIQRNDYVGLVKVTERVDFTVNMDFLFLFFA